jgi:hypothetical protein
MWGYTNTEGSFVRTTAKNILSGSKIVQSPEHTVEIDSVGTRIICNAGTRPTLHMNYDDEGELWYFIGA